MLGNATLNWSLGLFTMVVWVGGAVFYFWTDIKLAYYRRRARRAERRDARKT